MNPILIKNVAIAAVISSLSLSAFAQRGHLPPRDHSSESDRGSSERSSSSESSSSSSSSSSDSGSSSSSSWGSSSSSSDSSSSSSSGRDSSSSSSSSSSTDWSSIREQRRHDAGRDESPRSSEPAVVQRELPREQPVYTAPSRDIDNGSSSSDRGTISRDVSTPRPRAPIESPREPAQVGGGSSGGSSGSVEAPIGRDVSSPRPRAPIEKPSDSAPARDIGRGPTSGGLTEKPMVRDGQGGLKPVERADRNNPVSQIERTARVQDIERIRDMRRVEAGRTGRGVTSSGRAPSNRESSSWRTSEAQRSHYDDYRNAARYQQYRQRYDVWNTSYNPYVYRYNDYYWSIWNDLDWRYSYSHYYDYGFYGGFYYPTRHCHVEYYFNYPVVFWLYNPQYVGYQDNYRYWYGSSYSSANVTPFRYARVFFPTDTMRDLGVEISSMSVIMQTNFRSALTLVTDQIVRRLRAGFDATLNLRANEVVVNHYENLRGRALVIEGYVSHGSTKVAFKALLDIMTPAKSLVFIPTSYYPTEQDLVQLDKMNDRIWQLGGNPYQAVQEPTDYDVEDVNPFQP